MLLRNFLTLYYINRNIFLYLFVLILMFISTSYPLSAQDPETLDHGDVKLECAVGPIIKDFSANKKAWKVVVSGPGAVEVIKYNSTVPPMTTQFKWKLGDQGLENYWDLTPISPSPFAFKGTAMIPEVKLPQSNADFGDAHGIIKLETNNGNAYSTDPSPNPGQKAKVFFRRYDVNYHDPKVPNWFYYWGNAAIIKGLNTSPGIPLATVNKYPLPAGFVMATTPTPITIPFLYSNQGAFKYIPGGSGTAGSHLSAAPIKKESTGEVMSDGRIRMVGVGYFNQSITIGEWCGYEINELSPPVGGANIVLEAVEAFANTLRHEMHHFNCILSLWPNGYNSELDEDEDFYPDDFEDKNKIFGFNKSIKEPAYNPMYNPLYLIGENSVTHWQELQCRLIGHSKKNELDGVDWSYDPNGKYIGKQWK